MPRKCALTGKTVMFGNNVSHAHNKTRRKFLPNLQNISFLSDILQRKIQLRVTPFGVRTVESKGGLDEYLLNTCNCKLSKKAQIIKKEIIQAKKEVNK
ncbi:MAG: 50S ribosomal protein L28 [Alphaproteobacteria bacterium]|nr:50S ribosomal protein L28 [Alphaproteobacteria bacterium]